MDFSPLYRRAGRQLLLRGLTALSVLLLLLLAAGPHSALAALLAPENIREAGGVPKDSEMHLPSDQELTPWIHDPSVFTIDEGDRTEMREVAVQDVETIKLDNLVPPIHFDQGEAEILPEYLSLLRNVLADMRGKNNVRLHFIGHADSQKLSPTLQAQYGDNFGLSKERAGTAAEYCQLALDLPPEAISYEGLGDSKPLASNKTEAGRRQNRRVEVQVWHDLITERMEEQEVIISRELKRLKVCRTETVCKMRYKVGHSHRARVKNLVSPMHYEKGLLTVPGHFIQQIQRALNNLGSEENVQVSFTAYTDNLRLQGRDERIYGDHVGLSKAVGRRVSLAVQEALKLPSAAVTSTGKGAMQPLASNDTQQGRAMNRRVEVDFWHDDPLQSLPDEPQICPEDIGADTITRVYTPLTGPIGPIMFEGGDPVLPEGYTDELAAVMAEVSDKSNARLRFVGYTKDQRLNRRTASVYGDDIGWSTARARRARDAVMAQMGLAEAQTEFEGRGYVYSHDVVNAGFLAAESSHVMVEVVYDELIALDKYEGVDITRLTREVELADPFGLNQMRITVDGDPVDDPGKCSADVQRCTDLALQKAKIQFKHDNLRLEPRLNITAWPRTIRYQDRSDTLEVEDLVNFRLYSNYRSFIAQAQVRIFADGKSLRDEPLAVIAIDDDGRAQWQPGLVDYSAPGKVLQYVVRVYDAEGHFDQTRPQPLWLVDELDPLTNGETDLNRELLAGYGESRLAVRNIPLSGGTVQAFGSAIPPDHGVWMAGYSVPVAENGKFIAEEILPPGMHTVEVAVLDSAGNGELYLRDLALEKSDWFTVALADLTFSADDTSGPAHLLAPERQQYSDDMNLQGRLAFYTNGKFAGGWGITASGDTREGPLDEIFSNFLDKSPDALFRRMDPDYHYPTLGDDSTLVEDAPTMGKFYVKAKKNESFAMWGNFTIDYTDNDLAQVDRGLYGFNIHDQPLNTTSFGEARFLLDAFAADPGTVAGRDEFRGTGGSLYFLGRQDILQGSERLRVEVRDKDSGIVLATKNLVPLLDYDIDYLQGRLMLTKPLASFADDELLVDSGSSSGHPVYLVSRYEFSPGFEDPDAMAFGGRLHYWFNDFVKLGATVSQDSAGDVDTSLQGVDFTLRKSAATWLKVEGGRSSGPGLSQSSSLDGGFNFGSASAGADEETSATAYRVDANVGFADFFEAGRGTLSLYMQNSDGGYSAPGQLTANELKQYGLSAQVPFTDKIKARLKTDKREVDQGLVTEAVELDGDYAIDEHWTVSSGLRHDTREDESLLVPATQEEGDRTDMVAKLSYDSRGRWQSFGYVQESLSTTGTRDENSRVGAGGAYRFTDRFRLDGELSHGDLGIGGRLGTEYLYSDRTTLYSNYSQTDERSDTGVRARRGNMTSGFRTRYSDSASVYVEERYDHGDVPTGLTHSTGVELAATDRLNLGANLDLGTLKDNITSAELTRTAVGVNAGYGFASLKIASAVEYRDDESENPLDASLSSRTTWLFKNSLSYQLSADWRLFGKLNYATSDSSLGSAYDGNFTEGVLGYAYRPVGHDRLNALLKYTYFDNVPAVNPVGLVAGSTGAVAQRSHIGALDLMYDLSKRWSLGGKYAYRHGEVSLDRENPDYFLSRASLYVVRADYHIVHRWDALLEGRMLDLPDAEDQRSGVLCALYHHIGANIKLGVGYNFSDFTDDLTNLDYRHQGVFINLLGKI